MTLSILSPRFGNVAGGHSGVGSLSRDGLGSRNSLGIIVGFFYPTRYEILKVELMPTSEGRSNTYALGPILFIILKGPAL